MCIFWLIENHNTSRRYPLQVFLRQNHRLPVVKCFQFKILLLTFKSIHGLFSPYISQLINVQPKSSYSLRSNNNTVLQYPQQKTLPLATLGARSFAVNAAPLWNKLPAAIRNAASLNEFKNMISIGDYFTFYLD